MPIKGTPAGGRCRGAAAFLTWGMSSEHILGEYFVPILHLAFVYQYLTVSLNIGLCNSLNK